MTHTIGIDIGGTNISGGILTDKAELICKRFVAYPGADRPTESVSAVAALITDLLQDAQLSVQDLHSIGLAVPGSIDYRTQHVIDAFNLGYHRFPIVELLHRYFPRLAIYMENDANAAALGEYYCGAFKGFSCGLLVTLGTGVGAGLILNDTLFIGGMQSGFEFGHMILVNGGEHCSCGNDGCLEAYCSATALIRDGQRAARAHPESRLNRTDGARFDGKWVITCAQSGDAAAKDVFDRYIQNLGAALTSAINVLDPQVIAIGGGVSNAGDFLLKPLSDYVDAHAFFDPHAAIVKATLGNDAGIVGAAMLHAHRGR